MRYSVLTYIINNYEIIHEIKNKDPEAEYLLITDNPQTTSTTWTVIYDSDLEGLSVFDKCYAIRFNCFKYCNTNICVRIDGSIGVLNSLKPIIDFFEKGNYEAALMPHPNRDNFINEYKVWVETRDYPEAQANRCIQIMKDKGYDFSYRGMFQGCFSIQRNTEKTHKIDEMTYSLLKEMGINGVIERLDQIPFSFIMNSFFSNMKILPVSEQIIRSHYMQWYWHGSNARNDLGTYHILKPDYHYMFDKLVKCKYFHHPLLLKSWW